MHMKKLLIVALVCSAIIEALAPRADAAATNPVDINGAALHDGDLISANQSAGDPDIFIIKIKPFDGYNGAKRLFLNPAIFGMYAHLGGFERVRQVSFQVRESFVTSGLFRNCESNDQKVWATEVTGEDDGILHHVEMTGNQAVSEDAHFFDKVFCINNREDAFYVRSIYPYTHLSEVPRYYRGPRGCMVRPLCLDSEPRCLMPEPSSGWCPSPTPTPPPPTDSSYPMNVESAKLQGIRNEATGTDDVYVRITGTFPNTCYYTDINRSFPYPPKVTSAAGDENWRLDITVLGFIGQSTSCPPDYPRYTTDYFNLSPSMEQGRVYNLYANGVLIGSATPF